jgi:hypothetical protein
LLGTTIAVGELASADFGDFTCNGSACTLDATYLTGNQSITLSGDVSGSGATAITTAIGNDKVTEAMLKVVDTPTDEHILTYESTTGDFEWHTCAEITGSADLCDGSDATGAGGTGSNWTLGSGFLYHSTTTDEVLIGTSTATTAKLFLQGEANKNLFTIASSTGAQMLNISPNGSVTFGASDTTDGAFVYNPAADTKYFGIYDSANGKIYGIEESLPGSADVVGMGGYYNGLGIAGSSDSGGNPIFGVLNSSQSANGIGNVAFTIYDNNKIVDFHNTYNDGSGKIGIGSTTPYSQLVAQGNSTTPTIPVLTVASSTNSVLFSVGANGSTTIANLSAANCDVKSAAGLLYCGTDATGEAGGGITSLNGITEASQTFATSTGGTLWTITSSGSTHTWNIPATPSFTGITVTNASTTNLTVATDSYLGTVRGGTWNGTDIAVADGGTGASTLTDHGVLVGSGTDAITALSVGTDGQLLVGSSGADPVFATANGGANLTCTLGAGSFQIDLDATLTGLTGITSTGAIDFGGAVLEISNGTNPTADDAGELAHDTTDNQLVLDDYVVGRGVQRIWSVTVASTSPAFINAGLLPVPTELDGYTISRISCYTVGGTNKVIAVEDASANSSEDVTCDSDGATDDGSITNATYTASELSNIDFGATSGSVDYVSISVFGTWTRE